MTPNPANSNLPHRPRRGGACPRPFFSFPAPANLFPSRFSPAEKRKNIHLTQVVGGATIGQDAECRASAATRFFCFLAVRFDRVEETEMSYSLRPVVFCAPSSSAPRRLLRPVVFCAPSSSAPRRLLRPVVFCAPSSSAAPSFLLLLARFLPWQACSLQATDGRFFPPLELTPSRSMVRPLLIPGLESLAIPVVQSSATMKTTTMIRCDSSTINATITRNTHLARQTAQPIALSRRLRWWSRLRRQLVH